MLRKKLLARLGLLVVGFVGGAVVAILLLQGVLADLGSMKADSEAIIGGVQELRADLSSAESTAAELRRGVAVDTEPLAAAARSIDAVLTRLGAHDASDDAPGQWGTLIERVRTQVPRFLADASRQTSSGSAGPEVLAQESALRDAVGQLAVLAYRHVAASQSAVSARLRALIVWLTIAALAITNVAIFVLVRTAHMILRPIGALIEGSRALAAERFAHRIVINQHDEFDELAHAYNALADQLAANEERKVSALRQLAVTLNHEINNAISVIALQLRLLDRRSGGDPELAARLSGIHGNLERIAGVIASLRSVRRVVLTDYLPGEPMIDLARSIAPDEQPAASPIGVKGAGAS